MYSLIVIGVCFCGFLGILTWIAESLSGIHKEINRYVNLAKEIREEWKKEDEAIVNDPLHYDAEDPQDWWKKG